MARNSVIFIPATSSLTLEPSLGSLSDFSLAQNLSEFSTWLMLKDMFDE